MERNKNVIKAETLEKLDSVVESELKRLTDCGLSIKDFSLGYISKDYFTEEEEREIRNSIKQIEDGGVKFYCNSRGIDIPDKIKK